MSGELVPAGNVAAIEALAPQEREVAVTHMLGEARAWLAHAVETTAPRQIAEFKAFVATVAESTKQLNLSREIQLDAQEMVRRAERAVGVAIRKGQAAGEIRVTGQTAYRPGQPVTSVNRLGPAEVAGVNQRNELQPMYDMADGVSDEQFDAAISDAKAEGNLSRANVVRKVKGESPAPKSQRPDLLRKTRHIDPSRVVRETVHALEGIRLGLELIEPSDLTELDRREVIAWADSLSESLRSLSRLTRQLKELAQA